MRTQPKFVNVDIFGCDVDDFSRSGNDHFIDTDFDQFDPDVFKDLGRPVNPRRKPWSDGGYF